MVLVSILLSNLTYAMTAGSNPKKIDASPTVPATPAVNAKEISEFASQNVYKDVTQCINFDDQKKFFTITYIEEPLSISKETGPNFENRICHRNTLQWYNPAVNKRVVTFFESRDACSDNAQSLAQQHATDVYKAKFSCKEIQVFLSTGGTNLIYGYIQNIYRWGASMVGIVAVLIIILSGIQLSAAGGDPEAVNSAKKRILQSIAGIVILFLSGLILAVVNPNFFVTK